ncbi:unnamed protein product [Trichobilharzia regenti]|nr:unnamed protein product [Trichobilharzia regenti]
MMRKNRNQERVNFVVYVYTMMAMRMVLLAVVIIIVVQLQGNLCETRGNQYCCRSTHYNE